MCIPKCVCVSLEDVEEDRNAPDISSYIDAQSVGDGWWDTSLCLTEGEEVREKEMEWENVEMFVDARASACSFACHVKRILIIIRDGGTKRHILSHVPLLPLLDSTYVLTGRKHRMGTAREDSICATHTIWWGNMSTGQFRYRHSINNYFWSIVCDKLKRQQR